MSIETFSSSFLWKPFLDVVKNSPGFKLFCIGEREEYQKLLLSRLVHEGGRFIYSTTTSRRAVLAAAAVSLQGDTVQVHFYWSTNRKDDNLSLIGPFYLEITSIFSGKSLQYINFPVPNHFDQEKRWLKYAPPVSDEFGRKITWYKFRFRVFSQLAIASMELSKLRAAADVSVAKP